MTRSSGNMLQALRKVDMADQMALLEPDVDPLMTFLRALGKKRMVENMSFDWLERRPPTKTDAINRTTTYSAAATTLIVDNANRFRVDDIIEFFKTATGNEHALVTALSSAGETITVTRAYGTTAAGTLANNLVIIILANAAKTGSAKRAVLSREPTKITNYIQVMKHTYSIEEETQSTAIYGGGTALSQNQFEAMIEHKRENEFMALFGEKKLAGDSETNAQRQGAMDGMRKFCNTVTNMATTMTVNTWEQFIADSTLYGS
ncbi:MAG: SU10 major capsid protein, partial [bacterium]